MLTFRVITRSFHVWALASLSLASSHVFSQSHSCHFLPILMISEACVTICGAWGHSGDPNCVQSYSLMSLMPAMVIFCNGLNTSGKATPWSQRGRDIYNNPLIFYWNLLHTREIAAGGVGILMIPSVQCVAYWAPDIYHTMAVVSRSRNGTLSCHLSFSSVSACPKYLVIFLVISNSFASAVLSTSDTAVWWWCQNTD